MISKTLLSLALFAACATVIISSPIVQNDDSQLPEEGEVILEYIAEKLGQALPNVAGEIQTRQTPNTTTTNTTTTPASGSLFAFPTLQSYLANAPTTGGPYVSLVPLSVLFSTIFKG